MYPNPNGVEGRWRHIAYVMSKPTSIPCVNRPLPVEDHGFIALDMDRGNGPLVVKFIEPIEDEM